MTPHYLLRYTNPYGEKFYFVSLGEPWPERPGLYPIAATTTHMDRAFQFNCLKDALDVWVKSNRVPGWVALEVAETGMREVEL